jgi:hypothetical protein
MNVSCSIELYVLVDNTGRILYSGSYNDCYCHINNGLYKDCKIVLLKGEY